MSTKTIYKRIALVAVASLGFGVLTSVSPASAYTQVFLTGTPTVTVSTSTVAGSQTQVSGANNFVQVVTDATAGLVTISGSTLSSATATTTVATGGLSAVQTAAAATYTIPTKTAGEITLNFYSTSGGVTSTTITDQLIITVIDASAYLVSATNSTSIISAGSAAAASADAVVTASNLSTATQAAVIHVAAKDGTAAKTAVSGVISATIDGPGIIGISAATTTTAASAKFASYTGSSAKVTVWPDLSGVGGISTIKIYSGTTLIGTESVKFYGAVKTLASATILGSILDTATSGDALFAAVISATDSSGTAIALTTTELSVDAAAATAAGVSVAFAAAGGSARVISGKAVATTDVVMSVTPTATKTGNKSLVVTHTDPVTAVKTTVTVSFTVGLAQATTAVLSTDKLTYLPGEKMTLTLTLKDAGGFAVADNATGTAVLATGGITSSVSLSGDATTSADVPTVAGKKTWTVYAPLASGPVVFAGKTGTSSTLAPATAVTLAATVTVSDSATMSALTTLINSLIAKINALNKLVIKIQKKVKA